MAARGIITDDMKRLVREQRLAYVATVCPDGTPNLSHKGTMTVWDDGHLVFADIRSPGTVSNLKTNSAIEINVVDIFLRKGYRFKGTASVLTEGPLFEQIMQLYRDQVQRADERIRSIVLVKVELALPVTSPGYDLGATEDEMKERWQHYYDSLEGTGPVTSASE